MAFYVTVGPDGPTASVSDIEQSAPRRRFAPRSEVPGRASDVYCKLIVRIRIIDWSLAGARRNVVWCMTPTLSPAHVDTVRRIVADLKNRPGPLLEVLHAVQAALGYVPEGAIPLVAEGLNVSRAEVHGVVTFYHYFRRTPPGKHVVSLCRAEACQSMGADALAEHAKRKLGVDFHETTDDGEFSLEPIYCLGNCACSPAALVDGRLYGRLTPESFDAMLATEQSRKK